MTSETLSVASIVGIGGSGKTTLAQYVYNDDKVKCWFDVRFWVDVNQEFDVKDILEKILARAMNERPIMSDTEYRENIQYHYFIQAIGGKKFLLILDNIWDEPKLRLKWMNLRSLLKVGAYGSKVLITTRNQKVCRTMDSDSPHILHDLTEEDTWSLFKHIAFTRWHEPGVEMIAKEIAKMCPNVPLVIRNIGSLLAGKHTVQEWQAFRDDQFANFTSYGKDVMQTLKLSYDRLDTRLKLCVNYCTLIPKGMEFWKDEMIHRWIALDYVDPFYKNQSLEDAGEEYITILTNSGFLKHTGTQCISIYEFIHHYKMHDVMYDLVHSLVGSLYKVAYWYTDEFDRKVHHVSCNLVTNSSSFWEVPSSLLKIKHLQSFIVPNNTLNYSENAKAINWSSCYRLTSDFQCLRVLDLKGLAIKDLPKSVGELTCLKFLNLSYTHLEKLPNFITRLLNLQSLYLNGCEKLQELPQDISKLAKLRHLRLNRSKLAHMPFGLGLLTDLRTLDTFIVSESATNHVGKLADLKNLNNLQGSLTIKLLRESKVVVLEAKAPILKMKERLKELTISFSGGTKEDEIVLQSLQPPADLDVLSIVGYGGEKFPYWMRDDQLKSHLSNLVRIRINLCYSKSFKYICSMGRLLHLRYLHLEGLLYVEYIESNIATLDELHHTPLYPSLEELKIICMPKLKGWWRISSSGGHVKDQSHLVDWKPAFPKLRCLRVCSVKLALTISGPPLTGFTSLNELDFQCDAAGLSRLTPQQPQMLTVLSKTFPNLKKLTFSWCNKMQFIPEEVQGFSSLEKLYFSCCKQLKEIPEWIVDNLTSLNDLSLTDCPMLESLPITYLANLRSLVIFGCPILKEKCQTQTGEYWPYIHHIPKLFIN